MTYLFTVVIRSVEYPRHFYMGVHPRGVKADKITVRLLLLRRCCSCFCEDISVVVQLCGKHYGFLAPLLLLLLTYDPGCTCGRHLNKSLTALRIFFERPKFNKGFKTPFN